MLWESRQWLVSVKPEELHKIEMLPQQQALHCGLKLALAESAIYDGYPCSFNDSQFSSLPIISLRLGGHETIAAKPGVDGGGKKHHQGSSSREFDPRDGRIHASA